MLSATSVEMTFVVWMGYDRHCNDKGKSWLGSGVRSHSSQVRDEWGTRHPVAGAEVGAGVG